MKQTLITSTHESCPACGETSLASEHTTETFEYGRGDDVVKLSAPVTVYTCVSCGMGFSTADSEDARHKAVCSYLGVMTPAEIVAIREKYGFSQQEFANVTGLGRASLGRWETGAVIQNSSIDNLLFLISYQENFQRLLARAEARHHEIPANCVGEFPFLAGENMNRALVQSVAFSLYMQ